MVKKIVRDDFNYWPSFVDLMSILFITFLTIFFILFLSEKYLSYLVSEGLEDLNELQSHFSDRTTVAYSQGRIVISDKVLFDLDSFELTSEGRDVLFEVGESLKQYMKDKKANFSIVVEGHTDTRGSNPHNYYLSFERAKAVTDFWEQKINFGIISDKEIDLIPAGYGENRLAYSTDDNIDKPENRRIEIRVIPKFDKILYEIIN